MTIELLNISSCFNDDCNVKDDCFRYTARYRMKYRLSALYTEDEPCYFFWSTELETKKENK